MSKSVKSAVSAVLAALILLVPLAVGASGADGKLKVFVASDLHYCCAEENGSLADSSDGIPGSELYGHTNIQGQMTFESEAILMAMLKDLSASDADILLIPGDINCGENFDSARRIADIFRAFERETGKRIFVVPGNHDIESESGGDPLTIDDFKQIFADFGFSEALAADTDSCSYAAELESGYRLLAIDSCIYGEDGGDIDDGVYEFISAQVQRAREDGVRLVAMMHHALLAHFPLQSVIGGSLVVDNSRDIANQFADWGIKYIFTGHFHANDIAEAVSAKGNRIYDIMTGSLITSPNAYRYVEFGADKTVVTSRFVTEIDTRYLQSGYSPAQLALLENDFPAFARGYFEAGVERWIRQYIGTPRKVAKLFNVESDTPAYDFLASIMAPAGEALTLPLYSDPSAPDSPSLEAIAAEAGAEFPHTDYTSFPDLAAQIIGNLFTGDEKLSVASPETWLLITSLKAAISYALSGIVTEAFLPKGAADLLGSFGMTADALTDKIARRLFVETAAGKITLTLLSPILDGILSDGYAPSDGYAELEGFSSPAPKFAAFDVPLSALQIFRFIISRFLFPVLRSLFTVL